MDAWMASAIVIAGFLVLAYLACDLNHRSDSDWDKSEILVMYFASCGLLLMFSTVALDPLIAGAMQVCGCMSLGVGVHYMSIYVRDYIREQQDKRKKENS